MTFLPELHVADVLLFLLVLARIGTLVAIAPVFGSAAVPLRLRAALALALALLVVPLELAKAPSLPDSWSAYLVVAGAEALVGLVLGLGVLVLFSAVQVSGRLISQMSGMQLAEVFDPGFETSVPVFSQLMFYVTLAVFVSMGGHRHVLEALLDTFVWLPVGQGEFSQSITAAMTSVLTQSFVLGIRAAAPAMVALLLATLILGLAGRTLPQLNVMSLGFGASAAVALVVLGVSLGAGAWAFPDQLEPALETVLDAMGPPALPGDSGAANDKRADNVTYENPPAEPGAARQS